MAFFDDIPTRSNGEDIEASWFNIFKTKLQGFLSSEVLDEDDMVSNADDKLATQQSIKAYVDTNDLLKTDKATLTTKGDIYVATGASAPARVGVGSNGQALVADSAEASGVKWGAVSGGNNTITTETANFTAQVGHLHRVDSSGGAITITMPSSPSSGDSFVVQKISSDFSAITITGISAVHTLNETVTLTYDSGWFVENRLIPTITTSYTPTGNWTSNITYQGHWWRIGNRIYIDTITLINGAGSTGNFTVNLPVGVTINASAIAAVYTDNAAINDAGSGTFHGSAVYNNTTSVTARYLQNFSGVQYQVQVSATAPFGTLNSGDYVSLTANFPIVGWNG